MEGRLLKVKVSKLYYEQDLSKIEISKNLRISRFKVAKLIDDAVKEGIVKINIEEPKNNFIDLENKIERKFKIFRVCIVDSYPDYNITKKNIGKAAANCFIDMIQDGDTVGIAWGTTIYEMINEIPSEINRKNVSVVQLTGGLNQVETAYNAIELSRRLSKIFNAKCYQLYAPAIVDDIKTKELLFNDSNIKRTIEMFNKVDIAIIGIGAVAPEPSTILYKDGVLKKEDIKKIFDSCAIGDINTNFYDMEGNSCKTKLEDRTIGMDISQLKKIRYVIGVAGGESKINAIYGALRGKIISILATDYKTAKGLLEK